jgi:hypothetical protein
MQNMTRLLDVIDRAYSGPFVEAKNFGLQNVAHGVAGVLKKYGIKFNKERIIQSNAVRRLTCAAVGEWRRLCFP